MERIELARGRWVRFSRPMYISDRKAISTATDAAEDTRLLDMMEAIGAVLEAAVEERSWEGDFLQVTTDELNDLTRAWAQQSEDDALPPAEGNDSATT